ncbi:MAG TPA: HAMP domain-containing sensor histidine kinase [Candidatus Limnocylindrales bacterium]|nr:HAMP domain-containing sensor histidine kinase [Candidatus Limnocylindrales bacterium]
MTPDPFAPVEKLLDELLGVARSGALIPVRLPGQIEALQTALQRAKEEAGKQGAAEPFDKEAYLTDQAYFIGHAIHELRTPMTSIRGYADMMASMGSLTDMQTQFLDTIRTNSRRMETLMQDVADINKLRHGTLKIAVKMDMFKNIAMMTEKAMTPTAVQLGRTLTFEIPQGLPILNTDGEMIAKALNKLVENALRYQDKDGGEVKVAARPEDGKLVVTITDTGIGMTAGELAQLGTLYFRSDNDTVREFKGSGLGIPVAFGIIQLLGGEVKVESEAGKGSTFTVMLPGMS